MFLLCICLWLCCYCVCEVIVRLNVVCLNDVVCLISRLLVLFVWCRRRVLCGLILMLLL